MAWRKGKEAIVEGDEETRWWKRVNEDIRLAIMGEAEGKGGGTQEKELVNDKVERLCRLLKDNPMKLRKKEKEEVIRYLDVDDIISWALKWWQVEEKALEGYACLNLKAGRFLPSREKVDRLMRLMLVCGVEKLKVVDLYILYNNFPKAAFASILLHALESYSKRHLDGGRSLYPKEMRANIGKACSVLPWKLLAHVMYKLSSLPVFKCNFSTSTGPSEEEEEDEIQKKAAENCDLCYGKGKHSGVYGYYCSYWRSVPCGVTVGPMYGLVCSCCGYSNHISRNTWVRSCCYCFSPEGKATPYGHIWDSDI